MYRKRIKRLVDIGIGLMLLPLFLLVMVVVGLAIKIEDGGPVMYNAARLGKNGETFTMYKFRSMKVDAPDIRRSDGTTFNDEFDSRLTKVGSFIRKTSMDEIPQILNVIMGEMSIIGPRPDLPDAMSVYTEEQKVKLQVVPGITGYNQAYFRNAVDANQRFMNDVYYVQNICFYLDVTILFKTIQIVLGQKNIYKS